MKRYEDNKSHITTKFNDGLKKVFRTIIYPKIELDVEDTYIESRQGDRLDNIAYQYYRDTTLWWVLAEANHIGKGTMYVDPGMKIRIPHPEKVFSIINKLYDIENERL